MEPRLKLQAAKMPLSPLIRDESKSGTNKIKFVNPNTDNYEGNIRSCAARELPMAPKMLHEGQTAIVCGSGPSLKDPAVLSRIKEEVELGAIVYACKAAIKLLAAAGITVTYGVSMDPGSHIADPRKIAKVPGVVHLIASSSDPELFDYLLGSEHGDPAEVWVFHSACGYAEQLPRADVEQLDPVEQLLYVEHETPDGVVYQKDEMSLYTALFPDNSTMTGGFNVVNRAVSLAQYMGAQKIILAGADCGWRDGADMYCDGPAHRPGVNMSDKGVVDGANWNTRPDMLASGVALARVAKEAGESEFEVLGDTLPQALCKRDEEFLQLVASF